MHPPRFKRVRFLHIHVVVLMFVGGFVLSGCTSSPGASGTSLMPSDTIASAVSRDSALAVLSSMQRTAFDSAFADLDEYAFTRYVRTEQLDPSGRITAVRSYVLRYPPGTGAGTIQRRDSVGAFRQGGLFGRAAPARNPTERPANLAAQVLPDQPAYVEPRTREAFRYALRADTLLDGTPVYVVEATARGSGTGRDQGVRYAHLRLDRASRELIGITMVRADAVLLFGEESRLTLQLRPVAEGSRWVPHLVRVRASVNVPFRTPRQFRTVSAFYEYGSS